MEHHQYLSPNRRLVFIYQPDHLYFALESQVLDSDLSLIWAAEWTKVILEEGPRYDA